MSDTDTPSNDVQDYGVQPPAIPDDDATEGSVVDDDEKIAPSETADVSTATSSSDQLPIINDIIGKIDEADNILIALSSDPSVDELATAIALSLSLDKLEKRVTAIYSGETPDALSFLKPEDTFESKPDTLQDFVIALNKNKADHLRYKVDGDYVKIFITPYRSRISEEDLEFSYGDFNVDLVIALNVANGVDLDSALREHGRIMHDATIINITNAKPGKLGEIEWSDTKASSVSEMVATLLLTIGKLDEPEATALLTGIIAATDRFANSHTTSHSLEIASRLINAGADQQIVAKNLAASVKGDNSKAGSTSSTHEKASIADSIREKAIAKDSEDDDPTSLDIRHHDEAVESDEPDEKPAVPSYQEILDEPEDSPAESEEDSATSDKAEEEAEDESLSEDLEATEATLSNAGAEVVPEAEKKPFSLEVNTSPKKMLKKEDGSEAPSTSPETLVQSSEPESKDNDEDGDGIVGPFGSDDEETAKEENDAPNNFTSSKTEKTITPPSDMNSQSDSSTHNNPATLSTPDVASAPEVNNVPDMNYMPMPSDEILPPPPTPPIDFSTGANPMNSPMPSSMPSNNQAMPPTSSNPFLNPTLNQSPSMPDAAPGTSMPPMPNSNPFIASPSMPPQPNNNPPLNAPGSFQIPGM